MAEKTKLAKLQQELKKKKKKKVEKNIIYC